MKLSCILAVVISGIAFNGNVNCNPLDKPDLRNTKRSLKNFGTMIECETQGDKWRYNGYGCWCGYGGAGTPLDGTDRCCYDHDKCYDRLMEGDECTTTADPYLVSYKVDKCSECAPASDYSYWDSLGWTTVACCTVICACDSVAAKCFAQSYFNASYASYDKRKCGYSTAAK